MSQYLKSLKSCKNVKIPPEFLLLVQTLLSAHKVGSLSPSFQLLFVFFGNLLMSITDSRLAATIYRFPRVCVLLPRWRNGT